MGRFWGSVLKGVGKVCSRDLFTLAGGHGVPFAFSEAREGRGEKREAERAKREKAKNLYKNQLGSSSR